MAGYRRFVAYMYEYKNGQKDVNRGFVKVEARDGQCRIQMGLKGIGRGTASDCKVYGFVREEGFLNGTLLGVLPIRNGLVQGVLQMDETQMGDQAYALDQLCGMIVLEDDGGRYATQWDDQPVDFERFQSGGQMLYKEKMEEDESEDRQKPEEGKIREEESAMSEADVGLSDTGSEDMLQAEEIHGGSLEAEQDARPGEIQVAEGDFCPFDDDTIENCRKITPDQLGYGERALLGNRFLIHGYQGFGHLLLGTMKGCRRQVLGVPGIYHQQERFAAEMYGFPHFKFSRTNCYPQERFGYWYRLIQSPDSHQGDGL